MDYLLVHFEKFGDVYQECDAGAVKRYLAPTGKFLFSEPPPGENYVHVDATPARLEWMPALEPTDQYYADHVKAAEYRALDADGEFKAVTSALSQAKVELYQAVRDTRRLLDDPTPDALAKVEAANPDVAAALDEKV